MLKIIQWVAIILAALSFALIVGVIAAEISNN